jgi:hypothetical protein
MLAQHLKIMDLVFLYKLMDFAWLAINLMFAIPKCYNIYRIYKRVSLKHNNFIHIHKSSILSGRHVSTFIGSSSGPQRKQIQNYIDFFIKTHCGILNAHRMYYNGTISTNTCILPYLFYLYNTSCEHLGSHNALL